jgi:DNA-directed RNA polymerase I, II, and III subunit RPABC2
MSDLEDYSDSENSKSSSESEVEPILKKKINSDADKINFTAYEEDSDLDESDNNSNEDSASLIEESESEDNNSQIGGADSDLEEGEIDEGLDSDNEEKAGNGEQVENEGDEVNEKKSSSKQLRPKKKIPVNYQDEDDEDDDDDENYLQKFDSEISKNYIIDFHPECLNHNYEEIAKLSNVVRNSENIIIDPLHRTIPFLTKYEKARILGQRAKQIETGAKPLVNLPENIIDSYIIAELELKEKKIPFIIKRPIPSGAFEYWHLRDLEMINF